MDIVNLVSVQIILFPLFTLCCQHYWQALSKRYIVKFIIWCFLIFFLRRFVHLLSLFRGTAGSSKSLCMSVAIREHSCF